MADSTGVGDYEPGTLITQEKKHTTAVTKGDVLSRDGTSKGWKTAPTSGATAPYAVAVKSKLAADTIIEVAIDGIVYVKANGAIDPGALVAPSGTTAGQVIAYTATGSPTATTATGEFLLPVGRYLGHVDENDGKTVPTAAADGDIVRIKLGTRG